MKGKEAKNQIISEYIHGDTRKVLDNLLQQQRQFKLIISSPPYNMDREYEKSSSIDTYIQQFDIIIGKLVKLLSDDGSICWQVGNYIDKSSKEVLPLDILFYPLFKKHNLVLRNRIIWHFQHGFHASQRFSGRYETILWFSKTDKYTFNLDDVRVPARYPGKTYYKGENKGKISGNPRGKNPSDLWVVKDDWDRQVWNIPNVKSNHKEKTIHPCQYPIELVERCILALTNKNDSVLDPYAGVGSSMIAALKNDRNSCGIEKYKKYIHAGEKRIALFKEGNLKMRYLGTEIPEPNPNMAVAKKPDYFLY
jgi:adenine-specific DNA-methyltransferase